MDQGGVNCTKDDRDQAYLVAQLKETAYAEA